jgi:glutamate carboxypeptidase
MQQLLSWCEAEQPWLRETVEALVRLESPSHDRDAVNRCGAELAHRVQALGGRVSRLPGGERGDHVRAEFDGEAPPVLVLGHFDTVWDLGEIARMPLREEAGRLYGPGIFDMKAAIAVSLLAVRALDTLGAPRPRIVMLWTTDEEIGSRTSRAAIEHEAAQSRAVLVLEPSLPGGAAKTSRKGCGEFELTVHGVAAHAGLDPGKGASAIHELARQIVALEQLQDLSRGITVNAGVVSGGTRTNVTAAEARALVDVRVQTLADALRIEETVRSLQPFNPATRLEITGAIDRPPLERSAAVLRLYDLARDVASSLGRVLEEGAAGGGSDGNFTAALGVPTLDGLGPQGDGAHARHEHIVLEDLPFRAALLCGVLSRLPVASKMER